MINIAIAKYKFYSVLIQLDSSGNLYAVDGFGKSHPFAIVGDNVFVPFAANTLTVQWLRRKLESPGQVIALI
jgi:hypothetical protein